jgi:hypothetical protein
MLGVPGRGIRVELWKEWFLKLVRDDYKDKLMCNARYEMPRRKILRFQNGCEYFKLRQQTQVKMS